MDDVMLNLIYKEAENPEGRRQLLTQALQYLRSSHTQTTAMKGVYAVLEAVLKRGCPRVCTDPRHDTPCLYDGCKACLMECEPPT